MKKFTKEEKEEVQFILNNYKASNFDIVIGKGLKLLKKIPVFYEMHNIIGLSYHAKKDFKQAIKHYKNLINQEPKHFGCLNNLGNSFHAINKINDARSCYEKCLEINPKYINALVNLGNLKKDSNNFNEAIEYYLKALDINNKIFIVHYQLALAYLALGDFSNAKKFFLSTLEKNFKFTTADRMLSTFIDYNNDKSHMDSMINKIKDSTIQEIYKSELYFALGKAYEDLKKYDQSYENYKLGNEIKEKIIKYNIKNDKKLFENIKSSFSKLNFENEKQENKSDKKLIFILGMPRSGTSLIEQILSSHEEIYGGGELRDLSLLVYEHFIDIESINFNKLTDSNNEIVNEIRATYLENLKRFNTSRKYITDKDPLNFRWLGLIKLAFPDSKIIHCTRNKRDIGFSLWKNYFGEDINFAYDFKNISNYYSLYEEIMNFWKNKIPNFIYDIKYEDLINNKEEEIKKVLENLQLKWDNNCLNFQKNLRPITTQSLVQARKPIYNTSINSWKKYSKKIIPLVNLMKK